MKNEVNMLHLEREGKFKGYVPSENPFMPKRPRPIHGHHTKHIFIQASQLFYDIDAVTGMIGRARRSENGVQDNTLPTSENDSYRPMFYRWFDKYLRNAESRMQAFVLKPVRVAQMNTLTEWDEKEITLLVPDYWDDTCYEDLVNAIHTYIVNGALYEYLSLTLTSKDPVTLDKQMQMEDAYDDIKKYICSTKPGSVKRPMKPF